MLQELLVGLARTMTAVRGTHEGTVVSADGYPLYYEATRRGEVFSLTLTATTSTIAAGNIVAAAAAASTQFGLINPATSTKNLVLLKFGMGVISGTSAAGSLFHGYIPNITSLTAASPGGTILSNILGGGAASVATPWASAGGSALTGSTQAAKTHRVADFSATATAQAVANGHVRAIEEIAGDIIIPPGVMWLPLWSGAGTTLLNSYSVTWQEVPVLA